jgi:hypothetical protein
MASITGYEQMSDNPTDNTILYHSIKHKLYKYITILYSTTVLLSLIFTDDIYINCKNTNSLYLLISTTFVSIFRSISLNNENTIQMFYMRKWTDKMITLILLWGVLELNTVCLSQDKFKYLFVFILLKVWFSYHLLQLIYSIFYSLYKHIYFARYINSIQIDLEGSIV